VSFAPHKFEGTLTYRALWPWEEAQRAAKGPLFERIGGSLTFVSDKYGRITVPAGARSNGASVPGAAKWYLDNDDPRVAGPAEVHDYHYERAGMLADGRRLTREQIDEIFHEGLLACGMRPTQAWLVHRCVRLFGGSHWNSAK
jgi:hypothetical protein